MSTDSKQKIEDMVSVEDVGSGLGLRDHREMPSPIQASSTRNQEQSFVKVHHRNGPPKLNQILTIDTTDELCSRHQQNSFRAVQTAQTSIGRSFDKRALNDFNNDSQYSAQFPNPYPVPFPGIISDRN